VLLAVDIGNTNITMGVFKDNCLVKKFAVATKQANLKVFLKTIFNKYPICDTIICSVVPKTTSLFKKQIQKISASSVIITGKDIKVPIKNLYHKPSQVGQDRLVNAYAGVVFYGKPLIAIDFGTAVTFDVVTKKGEYWGGMILPGLRISLEALSNKTALLPKITLNSPKEFIGRDTKNSMLSGVVYGFSALTDDMIERIRSKIGKNACAVGTGGNIGIVGKYCRRINKIDQDLTLKGLNLIYKQYKLTIINKLKRTAAPVASLSTGCNAA